MKRFKKRTTEQINSSVMQDKDFTGGYDFLPWLMYMRSYFTAFATMFFVIAITISLIAQDLLAISATSTLFFIISVLMYREWRLDKEGIAR